MHLRLTMAAEQPKKPMTAFFLYTEEQRPAITKQLGDEAKVKGAVIKTASEQWKALSEEAKAPYEKKAAEAKAAYDKAVEDFKASGGEIVRKRKAGKDEKVKKDKDKDAPKKPAGGGYGRFLAANRKEIVESMPAGSNQTTDVAKAAGARWKALSDDEKKPYEEEFAAKMEEFRAAMEAYKASNASAEKEDDASPEKEKPAKRAKKAEKLESPPKVAKPAKKEKAAAPAKRVSKAKGPEVPEIEAEVMAEAHKLGYESNLRNLAARDDVKSLGKSDKDLLAALKASSGLVNPARRALLGA